MKSILTKGLSLVLTVVLLVGTMTMLPLSVNAAGDSIATATSYTLGNTVYGSLTKNSDKDVYKFKLPTSGKINLNVSAYMNYTRYKVYDADGNELWNDYYYWNSTTEKMSLSKDMHLTSGTYYLSVSGDSGNYNFKITFTSAGESFKESGYGNNNDIKNADTVSLGNTYKGQLAENDEKDIYKISIPAGKVTLSVNAYIGRSVYHLYDVDGNEIWDDYFYWNDTTKKMTLTQDFELNGGTYYLAVSGETGNYNFCFSKRLSTPALKSAANVASGIQIKWSKVSGATGYYVYRKVGSAKSWTKIATVKSGSTVAYTDTKVTSSYNYKYTVVAYNSATNSGYSSSGIGIKRLANPPVKSAANTATGVKVTWGKVAGASGYYVYRKAGSSNTWTRVATIKSGSTVSYLDKKVSGAGVYRYTVRAYYGSTLSSFSATGRVTRFIGATTLKSATSVKSGITLKWTQASGANGYNIYRKTANSGWVRIASVAGKTKVAYTDKTAKKGVTYSYLVRAYNGAYLGAYKNYKNCKDKY